MDNFKHKKSFGQNFINDNSVIENIIKYSSIDRDTLVIEVGPGMGVLSEKIVSLCGNAILFEIDNRLSPIIKKRLSGYDNYELIIEDFLKVNVNDYIKKYNYKKIYFVANLPYYITTTIVNKIISEVYPDRIVVMVQNEVADRFSAPVGSKDYGYISVILNSYYDIKKLFKVNREKFTPVPNVDSAVILMDKNDKITGSRTNFNKLVSDSFKHKRKNLKNNLILGYDLNSINCILEEYGLDVNCRAENISCDIFIKLSSSNIYMN